MSRESYLDNVLRLVKAKEGKEEDFHFEYKPTCYLFPFTSRKPERPEFAKGFDGVVGAYTRILCGYDPKSKLDEELFVNIRNKVEINDPDDEKAFYGILKRFLCDYDGKLNIFSIPAYKYSLLADNRESIGESAIGEFLYRTFGEPVGVKEIFEEGKNTNFFEHLVLDTMWLNPGNSVEQDGICKIEKIKNLFLEDIKTLATDESLFLKDYSYLMAYYYFFYISQLSVLLNKGVNGNMNQLEKIYYLFEQESAVRSRKAVTSGFNVICESSKHLLANINVLAQLNALFGTKDKVLPEILEIYDDVSLEEKTDIVMALDEWIKIVNRKYRRKDEIPSELRGKIEYLSKVYRTEKTAFGSGTGSRYSLWIENMAKAFFTKRHGSSGTVLVVSQRLLLLMLFLCKKNERIKLKEFFVRLEKRGVSLDSDSKVLIESKLQELNLLDKKSDSGEAAYV